MKGEIRVSAQEREELIRLRRDFHRHPELAYEERRTASIAAARMRELGYEVREEVACTGVLASLGGGDRSLLLRADMDALPVAEENEVDYRSACDGVMHACGHDGHVAIAMVAAARFVARRPRGRIRFAFQPAEEGGRGADRMIEEGALEGVDAVLGLHLWNGLPLGTVGVTPGPAMAAADTFTLEVRGRGGHAAKPQETQDPVVEAARIVCDLQTIVSRGVDPFEAAVVSVTSVHAGTAFNVIPEVVSLRGTVRSFREEVRSEVHRRMREIVGDRHALEIARVTDPVVNDPRMCEIVKRAAGQVVGEKNVVEDARSMAGEDFASFLARVPGCFFFVGSAPADGGAPHHSPRFDIDEDALAVGLEVLVRAGRDYLERGFS